MSAQACLGVEQTRKSGYPPIERLDTADIRLDVAA